MAFWPLFLHWLFAGFVFAKNFSLKAKNKRGWILLPYKVRNACKNVTDVKNIFLPEQSILFFLHGPFDC